jgi:hypothetical protein
MGKHDRAKTKKGKEMNKNENWITPNPSFDPDSFTGLPVKIKIPWNGSEVVGTLKLEKRNDGGQIQISASYNADPFPNRSDLRSFYLTQDQLDEFHNRGASCVLIAPPKKPN